jgi:hypothetical protein
VFIKNILIKYYYNIHHQNILSISFILKYDNLYKSFFKLNQLYDICFYFIYLYCFNFFLNINAICFANMKDCITTIDAHNFINRGVLILINVGYQKRNGAKKILLDIYKTKLIFLLQK